MIGITQPRRVAAITVCERVSEEMESEVGGLVGYSVRFEQKYSRQTGMKFMADGMLLRECIVDPWLNHYSYIIIDEAHERTVNSDILLALLKLLLQKTKDLKVVVMSATIEVEKFQKYLGVEEDNMLWVEGRCHPIEIFYAKESQSDYVEAMLNTIL